MLDHDELPGYRMVIVTRASDPSSDSEVSHDRQFGYLEEEKTLLDESYDAKLVEHYRLNESASTMDRESLEEILEMAKNDEFDILMVWAIHRLTRANPWDTFEYLLKLREHGIIVYSDRDGYFDWDNADDADDLVDNITTSRAWRNEIDEGALENNRIYLEKGKWPYGPTPYGTKKVGNSDEDKEEVGDRVNQVAEEEEDVVEDELVIKDGYEWVHEEIFKAYVDGKDEEETSEYIESLIEEREADIDAPTKHQVENVLENEVFVGKLVLKRTGELVREKEDLKQVDPELFAEVQEMRQDDDSTDEPDYGPHDFPDFIYRLICRYGQEYAEGNISGLRWCCPECKSIDINISDTTVEFWDISLPKVYCKSSNCGYTGPVIRMKELHEIDFTLPMVCSDCQRTSYFDVEPVSVANEEEDCYKYTCRKCKEWMIKDKHPNEVRRAFNDQRNAISLRDDLDDSDQSAQNLTNGEESSSKAQSDSADATISDFVE